MHAVILGGSKGVGYFSALYILATPGNSVTLLLRSPGVIENDEKLAGYIQQGRARLVKGDACDEAANARLFEGEKVDVLITSIGALPQMTWKGPVLPQHDICAGSMRAILSVLGKMPGIQPRIVAVSSMGMDDEGHKAMPLMHRVLYPYLAHGPHQDKRALEYTLLRASRSVPTPSTPPPAEIIAAGDIDSLPQNVIDEIIIVRPALFIGADEPPREAKPSTGENIRVSYIKRTEVARFIVDECLPGNQTWVNKKPVVGY